MYVSTFSHSLQYLDILKQSQVLSYPFSLTKDRFQLKAIPFFTLQSDLNQDDIRGKRCCTGSSFWFVYVFWDVYNKYPRGIMQLPLVEIFKNRQVEALTYFTWACGWPCSEREVRLQPSWSPFQPLLFCVLDYKIQEAISYTSFKVGQSSVPETIQENSRESWYSRTCSQFYSR